MNMMVYNYSLDFKTYKLNLSFTCEKGGGIEFHFNIAHYNASIESNV